MCLSREVSFFWLISNWMTHPPLVLFHSFLPRLFFQQQTETVDFSFNQLADPRFTFHDHALVEAVKLENPEVHAFFRLLALCHTVMAEEKKEGEEGWSEQQIMLSRDR